MKALVVPNTYSVKEYSKYYTYWRRMLVSCYGPDCGIQMVGVPRIKKEVCKRWFKWHLFCEDMIDYDKPLDWHLLCLTDTFSPSCFMVPLEIYSFFKCRKGLKPIGVFDIGRTSKPFKVSVKVSGKNKYAGYYETVEAASEAYYKLKQTELRRLIKKYKSELGKIAVNELLKFEVSTL